MVATALRPVGSPQPRHVRFAPQNRLDSLLVATIIESLKPVEVTVVGDCARLHLEGLRPLDECRHPTRPVQERITRMHV